MRMPKVVWYCTGPDCDDQEPWQHAFALKCPTCHSRENVTRVVRFGNKEGK